MKFKRHKDDFKFISEIGKGGFSTVYKAIDINGLILNKNDILAIKIIDKTEVPQQVIKSELDIFLTLNTSVNYNDNIIKIYDYFEEDKLLYICMEYLNGTDLFNYVCDKSNIYNDSNIRNMLIQMINAIKFLHSKNISHGDIKLENFLKVDDRIVLIDFGLSYIGDHIIHAKKGTAMYVAPEMVFNVDKYGYDGKKTDMWALGTVLYILKYKAYPFLGRSLSGIPEHFNSEYERQSYSGDEIHHPAKYRNNEFIPIINGLICKNQDKRLCIEDLEKCFYNINIYKN